MFYNISLSHNFWLYMYTSRLFKNQELNWQFAMGKNHSEALLALSGSAM